MSEIELKPCPFCGAKAYAVHRAWVVAEHWEIQTGCAEGCINYGMEPEFSTEEEAAERWNRRAERTCRFEREFVEAAKDWYCRCSECGQVFPYYSLADRLRFCPNCGARVVE